jgi:prepilin-type processing-associated H-X9-DG protein
MNTPDTRRKGFQWGWWLLAAVLWGVIAAVVYPIFYRPISHSPGSSCSNNLHLIGLALWSYQADWDGKLPELRTVRQQAPESQGWPDLIRKYIKSESIFICPKAPGRHLSYAFNRRVSGLMPGSDEVYNIAEVVMAYDSVSDRPEFNNLNGDTVWHHQDGGMPQPGQYIPWDGPFEEYTKRWPKWAKPRHDGGNIVLFADGHVSTFESGLRPHFDPRAEGGFRP